MEELRRRTATSGSCARLPGGVRRRRRRHARVRAAGRGGGARVCASSSLFMFISKLAMTPILLDGVRSSRRATCPRVASGELQASYCLSEPDAGSDVAGMSTRAVRDGDHYVLSGTKVWITNAGVSDFYTVFAKTDPDAGHRGISAFVVEKDSPGFSIGKLEQQARRARIAHRGRCPRRLRVPAANLIGDEGRGFTYAMGALDRSRPLVGAQALGIAQGALEPRRATCRAPPVRPARSPTSRASSSCSPTWRPRWTRPACSSTRRARCSTPVTRGVRGPPRWRSCSPPTPRCGSPPTRPAPRRRRLHRVPGRADDARRQDHADLRGHEPDPAHRDRPHLLDEVR